MGSGGPEWELGMALGHPSMGMGSGYPRSGFGFGIGTAQPSHTPRSHRDPAVLPGAAPPALGRAAAPYLLCLHRALLWGTPTAPRCRPEVGQGRGDGGAVGWRGGKWGQGVALGTEWWHWDGGGGIEDRMVALGTNGGVGDRGVGAGDKMVALGTIVALGTELWALGTKWRRWGWSCGHWGQNGGVGDKMVALGTEPWALGTK